MNNLALKNIKASIDEAAPPDWPKPQQLLSKIMPEPYPIDALPDVIRNAVEEVHDFVKAPLSLVASSALATLSLAIQAYVDVKRAEKLQGPSSLYFFTIADSGERKSTCEGIYLAAIRQYQEEQIALMKPILEKYKASLDAWLAERDGLLLAIKSAAKSGKDISKLQDKLYDHQTAEPRAPKVPRILLSDETPENLAWSLARQWPSSGVVSSEAGLVLGAHGMGKDSVMRNLGLLNVLWDASTHSVGRRSSESFTVRGARLTIALQVQEPTLRNFFEKSGALARGMGFFARFLIAWPQSTQGQRFFTEPPSDWHFCNEFNRRLGSILANPIPLDDEGGLVPILMSLTEEAKAAWVDYHDSIERELTSGGELFEVRDVASKSADNAIRLAALFQVFQHGLGESIDLHSFEAASRIAAWHLNESRRFFCELALPPELADAVLLDRWLIELCQKKKDGSVNKNYIRQYGPLRDGMRLDRAVRELGDLDRLKLIENGRRRIVLINPELIDTTL